MPRLPVLLFCLTFGVAGLPALAEDQRAEQLGAALKLAEAGIAQGDVTPLILAREILAALAPSGAAAEALAANWSSEARFLARGDPDILARLDAIKSPARDPDLHLITFAPSVTLPEGTSLVRIHVQDGIALTAVTSEGAEICAVAPSGATWTCDAGLASGTLLFEGSGGDGRSHLILLTESRP